jgi:hypothetical protein
MTADPDTQNQLIKIAQHYRTLADTEKHGALNANALSGEFPFQSNAPVIVAQRQSELCSSK